MKNITAPAAIQATPRRACFNFMKPRGKIDSSGSFARPSSLRAAPRINKPSATHHNVSPAIR